MDYTPFKVTIKYYIPCAVHYVLVSYLFSGKGFTVDLDERSFTGLVEVQTQAEKHKLQVLLLSHPPVSVVRSTRTGFHTEAFPDFTIRTT